MRPFLRRESNPKPYQALRRLSCRIGPVQSGFSASVRPTPLHAGRQLDSRRTAEAPSESSSPVRYRANAVGVG